MGVSLCTQWGGKIAGSVHSVTLVKEIRHCCRLDAINLAHQQFY